MFPNIENPSLLRTIQLFPRSLHLSVKDELKESDECAVLAIVSIPVKMWKITVKSFRNPTPAKARSSHNLSREFYVSEYYNEYYTTESESHAESFS